jgi:hypothetical protein
VGRQVVRWNLALAVAVFLSVTSVDASAQEPTYEGVKSTPKGTIGLGLVGAELGLIIPAAVDFDEVWALTVFPLVGAAGGALAGYFALDEPGREKGSVAALVVGMAGIIPAVLLTVKAVRYDPERDYKHGPSPSLQTKRERRAREMAEAGPGLLRKSRSGFAVGAPGFSMGRATPMSPEAARLGGAGGPREMRLSLASGVF